MCFLSSIFVFKLYVTVRAKGLSHIGAGAFQLNTKCSFNHLGRSPDRCFYNKDHQGMMVDPMFSDRSKF